ncbi:hypothetical protein DIS24_g9543 [Lasiodiplodia hormozganensis]|uniref:Uncharacterized protein n=1 Tax=Lasiodiplodia hormozganensis TaxID=869390 RepID=A0AA39XUX2_9PEZI|nr:hypothetical protein DIS24_g9543 [Lasiodiplodia hormozganensis]
MGAISTPILPQPLPATYEPDERKYGSYTNIVKAVEAGYTLKPQLEIEKMVDDTGRLTAMVWHFRYNGMSDSAKRACMDIKVKNGSMEFHRVKNGAAAPGGAGRDDFMRDIRQRYLDARRAYATRVSTQLQKDVKTSKILKDVGEEKREKSCAAYTAKLNSLREEIESFDPCPLVHLSLLRLPHGSVSTKPTSRIRKTSLRA